MAEAKMTIPISLEKVIHKGIQEFAQQLWDDQRIIISKIDIDWIDVTTHDKPRFAVKNVVAVTQTIHEIKPEGLF